MSGWIKLHRGLIDWEWYSDHNTCRLFIHCIIRANFEDKVWRGISISRGSFYTSLDTLSSETGLSNRQIRTSLGKLEMTGDVSGSGMARGRMITVVNYESYQQDDRLSVDEKAGKGQARDRVATANKNLRTKELKNTNNYSSEDYSLSVAMYESICFVAPHTKEPNYENWANTIRLMREVDKIPIHTIQQVFKWANGNAFWKTNILSTSKLRKQFNQLQAKMVNTYEEDQSRQSSRGHKPTLPERVRANINAQRDARGVTRLDGEGMAETTGDVRLQVHEPVRGDARQHVGELFEGNYSEADC